MSRTHTTSSHRLAAFTCFLLSVCALFMQPASASDLIFAEGFESGGARAWSTAVGLRANFTDVAVGGARVCALDIEGRVRCAAPPHDAIAAPTGTFVDVAGSASGFCGLRAGGVLECWGGLTADAAFAAQLGPSSRFLPDIDDYICASNAAGTDIACNHHLTVATVAINDLDIETDPATGATECFAPTVGGLWCDTNGTTVQIEAATAYTDVAISHTDVCAIPVAGGTPECFLTDGSSLAPAVLSDEAPLDDVAELHGVADRNFLAIRSGGRLLNWSPAPGSGGESEAALASPHDFLVLNHGRSGAICGITTAHRIDCFGGWMEGEGIAPPGTQWTGVSGTPGRTLWTGPSEVPLQVGAGSPSRDSFALHPEGDLSYSFSSVFTSCGLTGGEFRCPLGTDQWAVPAGPWSQLETAGFRERVWCGIRSDQTLQCASEDPTSLISTVPAGAFTDVHVDAAPWLAPKEQAFAIDINGSLHCWYSDGSTCTPPGGSDFVAVDGRLGYPTAAVRMNGTVEEVVFGGSTAGEVFARHEGPFGHRADGTFAWWIDPSRAVPAEPLTSVTAMFSVPTPFGHDLVTVDACGIQADGDLLCWEDTGVRGLTQHEFSGDYLAAYGSQLLTLTDQDRLTRTVGVALRGTTLSRMSEGALTNSGRCLIDESGAMGCVGYVRAQPDPVTGEIPLLLPPEAEDAVVSGLSASEQMFCALSNGRAFCWQPDGTPHPDVTFNTPNDFSMVRASVLGACAVRNANLSNPTVVCDGDFALGSGIPTDPFPDIQGPIRDLSVDGFVACAIDGAGQLHCVGSSFALINVPSPPNYERISTSAYSSLRCLIDESSALTCYDLSDTLVLNPPGQFARVAAMRNRVCAVTTGGSAQCWGVEETMRSW